MKFMQVHTFYHPYLEEFYLRQPELAREGFQAQTDRILTDGFASSHLFTPYLAAHGYETQLVIANNRFAQWRWLQENGVTLQNEEQWLHEVVRRQIESYRPDVLYLTDPITFDARFLNWLSFKPRVVLGWRAAEIPNETDWRGFDLIISNYDVALQQAAARGAKESSYFIPGFPSWVPRQLAQEPKQHDLVFSGQVTADHSRRRRILTDVGKLPLQGERPLSLGYFIGKVGDRNDLPAGIAMYDKGAVWGMGMFRALAGGRIVLNAHIDLSGSQVGNMRLFEGTGVGSFMLTDHQEELNNYFELGREVESYRNLGELTEKINYYLDHDAEREEIARRGQRRCLKDYAMERRAEELAELLHRQLQKGGHHVESVPAQVQSIKKQAQEALNQGETQQAFDLLIQAKALKSPLQGLDLLRAHCFLRMGQPMGALEALREELRHVPGDPEAARMVEELQRQLPPPGQGAPAAVEPEFLELLGVIRPYTMLSEQRLYSLYTLARSVCDRDLPGNFVECGVAAGGSSALLAFVIKRYSKQPRRLFSFDSFSGMPKPTELDSHQGVDAESTGWGTGTCAAPEASVREICGKLGVSELVVTVKGYFEETLPNLRDWTGMISLLHLDGDWYSSTKAILDNLYDRLMPGALLQVDDYGYWDGCRKAIHEFEAARGISFQIKPIDGTGVWFARPDSFPVNRQVPRALFDEFQLDDPVAKGIASQMSTNERFQLYHALRTQLQMERGLLRFVEIGSYSGASLLLTHQALVRRSQQFQGICVEPGGTDQFHQIIELLKNDVVHLPLFSHDAAKRLTSMLEPDQLPQFIFVDGDHTYAGVRQDILDFYPLLKPGGVMLFHDYLPELDDRNRDFILHHHGNAEPGIRQACQELMEQTYRCERIDLPLLYPTDPTQTQAQLPIIPGVFSTVRAYRKPM